MNAANRTIAEPDAQVLLDMYEHTRALDGAVVSNIDVRELARRMGLRSATVGAACARLLTSGLVDRLAPEEARQAAPRGGGPPTPVYAVSEAGLQFVNARKEARRG